jgi:hypothetical protein
VFLGYICVIMRKLPEIYASLCVGFRDFMRKYGRDQGQGSGVRDQGSEVRNQKPV